MTAEPIDYDSLMQANLVRVFGEHDSSRRMKAIAELYADDAILYEPDAVATGHAAICQAVDILLSSLPPNFVFTAIGPAVGHHGLGRLRWQSAPPNGPVAVTGTDVVRIEGGRIQTLHVLLDPTGASAEPTITDTSPVP
jgi:SnoaL-like protein